MEEKRCESCMKMTARPVCEHCGYPQNKQNETHQLPVGTVLGERYQVGKVLGQGGFGITYLGWDKEAEEKVAVKEFYPSSTVNRDCGQTKFIHCNTTQMEPHYQMSRERFLREAKALARLKDIPEIVGIKDFLEENNTAYIIMEYVQGMDLAHYIQRRGGRLNVDETFRILKPVMEALAKVHKLGLVHRDISPDNIILHPMGGAKLLDFGAVRAVENADAEKSLTKSTEAILKHGFAPIEQYQTRGSLGPWTDEYAMCATVYYCLTGRIIEEATTRMAEEIDPDWTGIPGLTEAQIAALSKGMAVRAKNRFPGMDALIEALFPQPEPEPEPAPQPEPVPVPAPQPEPVPVPVPQPGPQEPPKPKKQPKPKAPKDPKKKNKAPLIAVACVAGILLVAGPLASMFLTWRDPSDPPGPLIQAGETTSAGQDTGSAPTEAVPQAPAEYTYRVARSEFPTNWNPFTYATDADLELLEYLSAGLYTFDMNATMDGYVLVPEMASGMPVDVTADYIGRYGITSGATERAWSIPLRSDLCWEDGTPITARDFAESAKRLLDPQAKNSQASLLFDGRLQGMLSVYNAHAYYQGTEGEYLENGLYKNYSLDQLTKSNGIYMTPEGYQVFLAVDRPIEDWLGGNTLKTYVDSYGSQYFSLTYWDRLVAMADDQGLVPLTDETRRMFADVTTGNPNWGETEYDLLHYMFYLAVNDTPIAWENVGILVPSEQELILILEEPKSGFDLLLALSQPMLVNTELYDSLGSQTTDGQYTNTYGTSPETTMSYGPYSLKAFTADTQYDLARNDSFFGLTSDTYQATRLIVDYSDDRDADFSAMLSGVYSEAFVPSSQLSAYKNSSSLFFTGDGSVFAMVFDPDLEGLRSAQRAAGAGVNKTILTIPQFRMAMSLGLDRMGFAIAASPGNGPALGLYSDYSISAPELGTSYRSTEAAKMALTGAWGMEYGPGKTYADLNAAEAAITGYDPQRARELFDEAYTLALQKGLIDSSSKVLITVGLPGDSDFYTNGFNFLRDHYTELVKGTQLEGRLIFESKQVDRNAFADALRAQEVDMLFGVGWSGNALDPYALMDAFLWPEYQYDSSTDYSVQEVTITINGTAYTASAQTWSLAMFGLPQEIRTARGTYETLSFGVQDGDPGTRLQILAALEKTVLENYCFIPMIDDSSAFLISHQVSYPIQEEIYGIGRGGIKYLHFNYTDIEWAEYVASCGGTIDYTK